MNVSDPRPTGAAAARGAHVDALDGLRGAAVLAVIAFHAGWLGGGFLGVDLFFVLSGFLITGILVDEIDVTGRVGLAAFWARRARRLLPALIVFLAAVVVWAATAGSIDQLDQTRRGLPAAAAYVSNWQQLAGRGYWSVFRDPSPLTHLWSLAIEEQFYLVWPLVFVVLAGRRALRTWLTGVCLGGVIASVVLLAHFADRPERAYLGTDTRMGAVLVGALAAMWWRRPSRRDLEPTQATAAAVLLVVAIGALWTTTTGTAGNLFRGILPLHWALTAALIVVLASSTASVASRAVGSRPLRWIGQRSYGLYLWHWLVGIAVWPGRGQWPYVLGRTAISIAVAAASYALVEEPVRRRRRWPRPRQAMNALGIATAVVLIAAVVLLPAPRRRVAAFDASSVTTASPTTAPPTTSANPSTAPSSTPQSTTSATSPATATTQPDALPPSAPPRTVLWIGDSVAYDLSPAVIAALDASGTNAVNGSVWGASFVRYGSFDPVVYIRRLLDQFHPDLVLAQLPLRDAGYDDGTQLVGLRALVAVATTAHVPVVLITPPPIADPGFDVHNPAGQRAAARTVAEQPDVVLLDSGALWGAAARPDLDGDGAPDRKRDDVHVCPQGAAKFGVWLSAQLATVVPGFTAADPASWVVGDWQNDTTYDQPPGACAPL